MGKPSQYSERDAGDPQRSLGLSHGQLSNTKNGNIYKGQRGIYGAGAILTVVRIGYSGLHTSPEVQYSRL